MNEWQPLHFVFCSQELHASKVMMSKPKMSQPRIVIYNRAYLSILCWIYKENILTCDIFICVIDQIMMTILQSKSNFSYYFFFFQKLTQAQKIFI